MHMPEKGAVPMPAAPPADVLRDVLTLAELERPKWGPGLAELREEGVLLNAGPDEEDEPGGTPETDPEKGNPDEPAPGGGSQNDNPDDTDWKQRYEDLRPEADRRQTLLADIEGRNGPERQAAALAERAGVELDDENGPEVEFGDEFDELDDLRDPHEEIDEIKRELAERDERQADERFEQLEQEYVETTVEQMEEAEGVELSDHDYELVVNYGLAHRDEHNGKPDLEGGLKALKASWESAQKRYEQSKDTDELPPVGANGEPKIDWSDKESRQKAGREAFRRHQRQSQHE
jgi:hypothetical protein